MAKPINGVPVLKGQAARWMSKYLKAARPNQEKKERAKQDRQIAQQITERR